MKSVTQMDDDFIISICETGGDNHGRILLKINSKYKSIDHAIIDAERIKSLFEVLTHIHITQLTFNYPNQ